MNKLRDYACSPFAYTRSEGLCWNVMREDYNKKDIVIFNVFHHRGFYRDICKAYAEHKNLKPFANAVRKIAMWYFWSKSEHEVVVTSWPPYLENAEIDRVVAERDRSIKDYGRCYRVSARPEVAVKIDIFDQLTLNWNHFISYLWAHRRQLVVEEE